MHPRHIKNYVNLMTRDLDYKDEAQIHEIFPKVVARHDNICLDLIPDMIELLNDIKGQTSGNQVLNVNSSHTTIETIHRLPVFKDLTEEILRVSRNFMFEYGYDPLRRKDLYMSNMWFNHSNEGNFIFPHIHHGSFLSCAYYVKANEEKHTVLFHDFTKNLHEEPVSFNKMNEVAFAMPCKVGRLLIFHSDFPHAVPQQEHEEERIVISGNMILRSIPSEERVS